nr:MBOAT family O-acyltransferase [Fusibacter tunisiensis]
MVFSSLVFINYFLPILMILYFSVPRSLRNGVLLTGSLLFYFYGEPVYTGLLIFSAVSDYSHSAYIERYRGTGRAKIALISSITINLAMLFFFKYADFFIESVNVLFGRDFNSLELSLPIGISFFTFQTMSYTIDVYRGSVKASRKFLPFATYVTLFPQLVAGPIVRYATLETQLINRHINLESLSSGIQRFIIGLSKKVLLANQLGEFTVAFRATESNSVLFTWAYAVTFTLQIYFDFSGYSDMAIGLGRLLGFEFPENFKYPLCAKSITDFWRRWHMTLGQWFRDYVYIPLGGNRVSHLKWLRNLLIVWGLTGLWHGADWNFIIWGLYFGIILAVEKWLNISKTTSKIGHIYVIGVVVVSFVIFNSLSMDQLWLDLKTMFGLSDVPFVTSETLFQLKNYSNLILFGVLGATPLPKLTLESMQNFKGVDRIRQFTDPVGLVILLWGVTAYLVDSSFNPFLYFRF